MIKNRVTEQQKGGNKMAKTKQKHIGPLVASLLFLGLGQAIKGQWQKFALIWAAYIVSVIFGTILAIVTLGLGLILLIPVLLGIYIWQAYDAYNN